AKILVDAAQRLAHYPIDVKPLDHPEHLDFVAAAGHKTYAPFGSSFLLGTSEIFDNAPPYIPSGGTVSFVTEDDIVFLKGTDRHTYGTPNIAGTIAFGKSIQFLSEIGMDYIRDHELHLLKRLLKGMKELSNVEIYGDFPLNQKLGVVTFNINGMRHNHVSQLLNEYSGIATRNGCFCAHPYIARLLKVSDIDATKLKDAIINGENPELPGAVRASIGLYNNEEEIDLLIETLSTIINNPKNTKNSVTVSVN
ncbi:MAG: aminotransferase class V-fold PLP-dependent enzyme, partial [Candidatus Heimdallarchaeota archaeon]|nr:aminotransferase class V-fold PLP-dependent enzyme [Candidatus Heimdallarchaeota archaeon]